MAYTTPVPYRFFLLAALPGNAMASTGCGDHWPELQLLLVTLTIGTLFVGALALLAWSVKRLVFRAAFPLDVVVTTSVLSTLLLGIFATLVLPEYESVFLSFHVDLPFQTRLLLRGRLFLWLPLLLVLALHYGTQGNAARGKYFAAALLIASSVVIVVLASLFSPTYRTCVI